MEKWGETGMVEMTMKKGPFLEISILD